MGWTSAASIRSAKIDKVFIKNDNNTQTIDAEADLTGFTNVGFTLDWTTNDGVATQMLYLALGQGSEAKVVSGSYTGTGIAARVINQLGFIPDFVIVKGANAVSAVFRTSTMANSKLAIGGVALAANHIQSLDSAGGGGFTLGSSAQVNAIGVMYYWTAFSQGAGKMTVGSYTGNGVAGQAINGLGFSPEAMFVMASRHQQSCLSRLRPRQFISVRRRRRRRYESHLARRGRVHAGSGCHCERRRRRLSLCRLERGGW